MKINIIVACGINNEIGKDNQLLWKLSDDMKFFKETTFQKIVVMGSKTYESIGSKPLPNRFNIVMTRDKRKYYDDFFKYNNFSYITSMAHMTSMEHMIRFLEKWDEEVFVIGGQNIYEQFIDIADNIYITRVNAEFEDADTFFPEIDYSKYKIHELGFYEKSEKNEYSFYISRLERI